MSRPTGGKSPTSLKPTRPVDVVDGIPDREARLAVWKYLLIVAAFAGWLAFLIYCRLAGNVGP